MYTQAFRAVHAEARGQHCGAGFLLPPRGSQGLNSGRQPWCQGPLSATPFCWPLCTSAQKKYLKDSSLAPFFASHCLQDSVYLSVLSWINISIFADYWLYTLSEFLRQVQLRLG